MTAFAVFVTLAAVLFGAASTAAIAAPKEVDFLSTRTTDLEVFMSVGAPAREVSAVRHRIESAPQVRRFSHLDTSDAYREFRRIFRDNRKLVDSIRRSDLPESFRLDMRSRSDAEHLARLARDWPGVDSALTPMPMSYEKLLSQIRLCAARGEEDFEVFMEVKAPQEQLDAVRDLVVSQPGLTITRILSREDSYAEFTKIFASQPDLVAKIRPVDLPASIRVRSSERLSEVVRTRLESASGVESVEEPSGFCDEMNRYLGAGWAPEDLARFMIARAQGDRA